MPPLPVAPNTLKIEIGGGTYDCDWYNIFYAQWSGSTPSVGTLTTYITDYLAPATDTAYGAEMSTNSAVKSYKVTDISSETGSVATGTDSTAGVRTGEIPPGSACVVATKEILRRYRGGHPRFYLPWGTAGTYESGSAKFWDPGFITDCQSKLDAMMSAICPGFIGESETQVTNIVNVSYLTGGARRETPQIDVVESYVVRQRVCSQRRRLGKLLG